MVISSRRGCFEYIYATHLTVLQDAVLAHGTSPAFKIPIPISTPDASHTVIKHEWQTVTYSQFLHDVESSARYWTRQFSNCAIPSRAVIGLWVSGWTYDDLVHIYGVSKAGYIPQLFSVNLPNPDVVLELLRKVGSRAVIVDSRFYDLARPVFEGSLEVFPVVPSAETASGSQMSPLASGSTMDAEVGIDETVFYFHTSGSTSGSPKVVPYSYRWLESALHKSEILMRPREERSKQDTTTWMGSMCHVGQTFMLLGGLQHGVCTVLPTSPAYNNDEFVHLVAHCGVNRINQFAAFLEPRLRAAQSDEKLHSLLKNMVDIICCGALSNEVVEWSWRNGISIRNLFGSTEAGATLISQGGNGPDASFLRPIAPETSSYEFRPIPTSNEQQHQSTAQLLEFIILPTSPDCPHESFTAKHGDGVFHTGDLFQSVGPGTYVFRGRDDDWIKMQSALRCDTKAIEDHTRLTCAQLISECVVVGSGRPSPAMFVEVPPSMAGYDLEKLKKEIIRKTRQFHSRRYVHERIVYPSHIVVVPQGSLPRTATKGNVRRMEVENRWKDTLDAMYC